MSLVLPDDLMRELQQLAETDNREPEALLREMLRLYRQQRNAVTPAIPHTPAEVRQSVYERARDYWRAHNRAERAALTDSALDEQFNFIDDGGVPHLKADQAPRPENPLSNLLGTLDTDSTDLSTSSRDTLNAYYRSRYARPD